MLQVPLISIQRSILLSIPCYDIDVFIAFLLLYYVFILDYGVRRIETCDCHRERRDTIAINKIK